MTRNQLYAAPEKLYCCSINEGTNSTQGNEQTNFSATLSRDGNVTSLIEISKRKKDVHKPKL